MVASHKTMKGQLAKDYLSYILKYNSSIFLLPWIL